MSNGILTFEEPLKLNDVPLLFFLYITLCFRLMADV